MKDRVLLHLLENPVESGAPIVPSILTQSGIAEQVGFPHRHFSILAGPLLRDGRVHEWTAHVEGYRQRRKVYGLTVSGRLAAIQLRDRLSTEVVRVRDSHGIREVTVAQVVSDSAGNLSILDVVRQASEAGVVDLSSRVVAEVTSFVEMLGGAPRVDRFVGRSTELERVREEPLGPRIFVVRGMPGIGKSTFAGRACETLRGSRNLFWHRVRPWDTLTSMLSGLGGFLDKLGKPGLQATLERGETHRACDVLRTDLPGFRAFLVFDDAHEGGIEVSSFLRLLKESLSPDSDVRILVLTRQALSFYDRRDVRLDGLVEEIELTGLMPEEVDTLLTGTLEADKIRILSNRLGGHPLFLRLVQATVHSAPAVYDALQDFHRFIEEQIYSGFSAGARSVMKLSSLYRVPIPREALIEDLEVSYDVILELADRCLLRQIGEDRYELHDSIREFFEGILTRSERRDFGRIAVGYLERQATMAFEEGAFLACVDFVSNALSLADSPERKGSLWERLGEAYARLGDLPASMTAYRDALRVAVEPETVARLHRKMAEEFLSKMDLPSSRVEIEAGFLALGTRVNAERGWLELMRARLTEEEGSPEAGYEHTLAALKILETTDDLSGHALALIVLGAHDMSVDSIAAAEDHLLQALRLARSARNPWLLEHALRSLAWVVGWGRGDTEQATAYYAEIDALARATGNPAIRVKSLGNRGYFDLLFKADFEAAEEKFTEVAEFAGRRYNEVGVLDSEQAIGVVRYFQGRYDEARAILEEIVAKRRRLGHTAAAVDIIGYLIESCLLEGDISAFRRIVAQCDEPDLSTWVKFEPSPLGAYRAIVALLDGDQRLARKLLEEASRGAKMPEAIHYYLLASVAFSLMGDQSAAEQHRSRSKELAASRSRRAFYSAADERGRRMTEVIQAAMVRR